MSMKYNQGYILYTVTPITIDKYMALYSNCYIKSLKSEVPSMYKYRIRSRLNAADAIIKPSSIGEYEPYLIVCDTGLYGHFTTSMLIKGDKKYIYSVHYPITIKQPYKQLKEHYSQYLANKLMETL